MVVLFLFLLPYKVITKNIYKHNFLSLTFEFFNLLYFILTIIFSNAMFLTNINSIYSTTKGKIN